MHTDPIVNMLSVELGGGTARKGGAQVWRRVSSTPPTRPSGNERTLPTHTPAKRRPHGAPCSHRGQWKAAWPAAPRACRGGGRGERRRRRCWPATRLPAAAARRLTQRWGSSSGTDMISFCLEACGTSMVTVCSLRALPQQMSSVGLSRVRAHHCISHLRQTRHTCRQVRVRKRLECAQNTDHLRRGSRKRCSHSGQTGRGKRGHTVHTCTSCSAACLPEMDSVASPPPFLLIAFRLLFPPPRSPRTSTPAS